MYVTSSGYTSSSLPTFQEDDIHRPLYMNSELSAKSNMEKVSKCGKSGKIEVGWTSFRRFRLD